MLFCATFHMDCGITVKANMSALRMWHLAQRNFQLQPHRSAGMQLDSDPGPSVASLFPSHATFPVSIWELATVNISKMKTKNQSAFN